MAYCSKCGSSLSEGDKVCGNCGEPVPGANRSSSNSNEIWMGILSYLGILALIPYFVKDQTPFVRAHAVRGINLLLLEVIVWVAVGVGDGSAVGVAVGRMPKDAGFTATCSSFEQ